MNREMLLKTLMIIFIFMHCLVSIHVGMFSDLANMHFAQLMSSRT